MNIGLQLRNSLALLKCVLREKPDALFLYRVNSFFVSVLRLVRLCRPQLCVMVYHNDDPFRKERMRRLKNHRYLRTIGLADVTYVYRTVNVDEAKQWGARKVKLLMSHYDSRCDVVSLPARGLHKPNSRVVFVGHHEPDGRIDCLDELFRNGTDLHIYGDEKWHEVFASKGWPQDHCHGKVFGNDYRQTVAGAAIALAFFSTDNRDDYTRRCFEIPVMGTLLMAPRTPSTEALFDNGSEAALFSDKEELASLVGYYNQHPEQRDAIALKAYRQMLAKGHSETARAQMVIDDVQAWQRGRQAGPATGS